MDAGAAVGADQESAVVVQPGEGALDDPAVAAEPGAVLGLWSKGIGSLIGTFSRWQTVVLVAQAGRYSKRLAELDRLVGPEDVVVRPRQT